MTSQEKKELIVAAFVGLPWILCLIHLWTRRGARLWKRVVWSLIVAIPIVGPLMYGGLFGGLEPHGPSTRPVVGQGGVSYDPTDRP